MACKHYKKELQPVQEIGSTAPNFFENWSCDLGRNVIADMHKRCTATPCNGPCWQDKLAQPAGK